MKYECIVRDVLQLDGSTVKTVGILRNVEMALHACPGCTMIQDISVAEVKPQFAICLSRDFTAQLVVSCLLIGHICHLKPDMEPMLQLELNLKPFITPNPTPLTLST
jgi:hypothetical protein